MAKPETARNKKQYRSNHLVEIGDSLYSCVCFLRTQQCVDEVCDAIYVLDGVSVPTPVGMIQPGGQYCSFMESL
ncbi:MAG TPA: hypothetical protein VGS97_11460, partial [Actinocrinis sp.]|uniref:hypothetical protein n=1 Tax=Actinocrinis sp. TaxID=1920516 RepID=UPI002DDD49AE